MRNILAAGAVETLASFALSNVLLGFDYDGTLAPITGSPARARMRAATRRLLRDVAASYPCVVISGRARGDVAARLAGLPIWHVIGNHGMEPWAETAAAARLVRRWLDVLRPRLESLPGVFLEDKRYSATVHYRHAPGKIRVQRIVAATARTLPGIRVIGGDEALNLIPTAGVDKGIALQRVRRALGCDTAIYVGDDETDEDAFASAPADQLLSIRVGSSRTSRARYALQRQRDMDHLLRRLRTLRSGSHAVLRAAR